MLWTTLFLMSIQAASAPAPLSASTPATLNTEQVADLCMAVSQKLHGGQPGERRYAFDRSIRRWSGVVGAAEPTSADVARIGEFWRQNAPNLRCSQLAFSIHEGHIWKLAIERSSEDFLEMALIDWNLSPNDLDCTGETALDYAERELAEAAGTSRARTLRTYRDLLLEHGGKRASELSAGERGSAVNCTG